jgi:hypothetical protein
MVVELSVVIAVVGCLIGVLGYFAGRDRKIAADSEWRGSVNGKLDAVVCIAGEVEQIRRVLTVHEGRICTLESSVKSAHKRVDGVAECKGYRA